MQHVNGTGHDARVVRLAAEQLGRIRPDAGALILPMREASGIAAEISFSNQQAQYLLVSLTAALSSISIRREAISSVELPKAGTWMDLKSWSIGVNESKDRVIVRLSSASGEEVDVRLDVDSLVRLNQDIRRVCSHSL
jgi:hypothetical protein